MTSERLSEIEADIELVLGSNWAGGMKISAVFERLTHVRSLCTALRKAWAERDALADEVDRLEEWLTPGVYKNRMEDRPAIVAAILAARKEQK